MHDFKWPIISTRTRIALELARTTVRVAPYLCCTLCLQRLLMSGRGTGHWPYRVSAIGCLCATSTRDGVDLLQRTIPQTSRPYYLHVRYHYAIHWYSQAMASNSHLAVAVAGDLTVGSLRDCDNRARVGRVTARMPIRHTRRDHHIEYCIITHRCTPTSRHYLTTVSSTAHSQCQKGVGNLG